MGRPFLEVVEASVKCMRSCSKLLDRHGPLRGEFAIYGGNWAFLRRM